MNIKVNKKLMISLFIFVDLFFIVLIASKDNINGAKNSLKFDNYSNVQSIEESMLVVNEGTANVIEASVTFEEELLIAQEIIMNEQQEFMTNQNQISQSIVNSNKQLKAKEEARKKAIAAKKAKLAQQKAMEERQKKAAADAKELQKAIANEQSCKGDDVSIGCKAANYAVQFNGMSYVFGGQWNGELPYKGTDCSGFTQGIYKHFGIDIPRVARDQAKAGYEVAVKDIQPGDLVFYSSNGKTVTHAGMYIGQGKIIHAQTPVYGIGIGRLDFSPTNLPRVHIRRVY